jgi:CheY-like chemotaxis protein
MIRRLEKQRNKLIDHASVAASIIALTGQASNRDQVEAFASGMDCFVTKPMSLARLKELVADWDTKGASNSPLLRDLD